MGIKVEIDYDAADMIVVESLKEQYSNISRMLEQRYVSKDNYAMYASKDNYGMFHHNKKKDIVAIKKLLKSFEDVLKYNMLEEDLVAFKKENNYALLCND